MVQQGELVAGFHSGFERTVRHKGMTGSDLQPPLDSGCLQTGNPFPSSQVEKLARHTHLHLDLRHIELGLTEKPFLTGTLKNMRGESLPKRAQTYMG